MTATRRSKIRLAIALAILSVVSWSGCDRFRVFGNGSGYSGLKRYVWNYPNYRCQRDGVEIPSHRDAIEVSVNDRGQITEAFSFGDLCSGETKKLDPSKLEPSRFDPDLFGYEFGTYRHWPDGVAVFVSEVWCQPEVPRESMPLEMEIAATQPDDKLSGVIRYSVGSQPASELKFSPVARGMNTTTRVYTASNFRLSVAVDAVSSSGPGKFVGELTSSIEGSVYSDKMLCRITPVPPAFLPGPSRSAFSANWAWISGSSTRNQRAVYGTRGVASPNAHPGGREILTSWRDRAGNLWLFGGRGCDTSSCSSNNALGDLWKFDGKLWTWVAGSSTVNNDGSYGVQGVASPSNQPGARGWSAVWEDRQGNFWMFGGYGYDSVGDEGRLNDLWKFDGTNWTWMGGSKTADALGNYGTRGVPAASNYPPGRDTVAYWADAAGNFWFFGGNGCDSVGCSALQNDLWKFDGANWTWMAGRSTGEQLGRYNTLGAPDPLNRPGAREDAFGWSDSSGNVWIYGGGGCDRDDCGWQGLDDLWKFDGTHWTWMHGSPNANQAPAFGPPGTASASIRPGARYQSMISLDVGGNLWVYGGAADCDTGSWPCGSSMSDLWVFDGKLWTFVGGSQTPNSSGTYGTLGTSVPGNSPGGRVNSIQWRDQSGNLVVFGGDGYDANGNRGYLNDLWISRPY